MSSQSVLRLCVCLHRSRSLSVPPSCLGYTCPPFASHMNSHTSFSTFRAWRVVPWLFDMKRVVMAMGSGWFLYAWRMRASRVNLRASCIGQSCNTCSVVSSPWPHAHVDPWSRRSSLDCCHLLFPRSMTSPMRRRAICVSCACGPLNCDFQFVPSGFIMCSMCCVRSAVRVCFSF